MSNNGQECISRKEPADERRLTRDTVEEASGCSPDGNSSVIQEKTKKQIMKFSGRQKMSHIRSTYQFRKEFIKYAHWDYPLSFYIKCFIIWFKVINLRYIEFFLNFVRLLNTIMCSFILYINIIDLVFVDILKSSWPFFFFCFYISVGKV